MKALIVYAFFVVPIPIIVGFLISAVVYVPCSLLLAQCSLKVKATVTPYMEIFTGLGAAIASLLSFKFLGSEPKMICGAILAVWAFIYFAWAKGSFLRWVSWLGGFLVGWFTLEKMLLP